MKAGRRVGQIYFNHGDGEGFIVWDDIFINDLCYNTCLGLDFVQDMEAEIADLRADVEECDRFGQTDTGDNPYRAIMEKRFDDPKIIKVFDVIWREWDEAGNCQASKRDLAKLAGVGIKKCNEAIYKLVSEGVLSVKQRFGLPNTYTVNKEWFEKRSEA